MVFEKTTLVGGQKIYAHAYGVCNGHCAVHNPSDHHMKTWPQHWREDRCFMERICPHGVGHPDPDHMAYIRTKFHEDDVAAEGMHGCDGCCKPPWATSLPKEETAK